MSATGQSAAFAPVASAPAFAAATLGADAAPVSSQVAAAPAAQVYQGVGGWLLVIAISMLLIFPAWTMTGSVRAFSDARNMRNGFTGMTDALRRLGLEKQVAGFGGFGEQMMAVATADLLIDLAMCGFAVYTAYGLLKRTPRAVLHTKIFFGAMFVYAFVREIAIPSINKVDIEGAGGVVLLLWGVAGSALAYFARSRRVRATYA